VAFVFLKDCCRYRQELQSLRFQPGTHSFDNFCLAFERQPVARSQICHGKVLARVAHGLSEAVVFAIAEAVEVAINKQHGLTQSSAVRRRVNVGDVGAIVQVPRIAWSESGDAERFDKGLKVSSRLEHGIRLYRWRMVLRIFKRIHEVHSGRSDDQS
jgi:hypothetical protein